MRSASRLYGAAVLSLFVATAMIGCSGGGGSVGSDDWWRKEQLEEQDRSLRDQNRLYSAYRGLGYSDSEARENVS